MAFSIHNSRFASLGPGVLAGIVALSACLHWAAPAEAQRMRRPDEGLTKAAPQLREAVSGVLDAARHGTVRIFVGDRPAALGTVVRDDGIVLTKASELDEDFVVELYDGRRVDGRLIGVAQEHDLAAIKLNVDRIPSLQVDVTAVENSAAGGWVLTPEPGRGVVVGNLSVSGLRRIPSSGGLLGVGLGQTQAGIPVFRVDPRGAADRAGLRPGDVITHIDGRLVGTMRDFVRNLRNAPPEAGFRLTISRDGEALVVPMMLQNGGMGVTLVTEAAGVLIANVAPGSGAEAAGVQVGDILLEIDERPVRDGPAVIRAVSRYKPGDEVSLALLREGQEEVLEAVIGYRSGRSLRGDLQNSMGSSLSDRAVDFPAVLQHDSVLNANEMGGPLLDLHGNVLGLNIARAGRTETYALPAQVIQGILPELLSGRLPVTTAPALESGQEAMPQERLQEE
jgi:S1-C subfamily serine protease